MLGSFLFQNFIQLIPVLSYTSIFLFILLYLPQKQKNIEMNRNIDTKWVKRTLQHRDPCQYNFSVVVQILTTDKDLSCSSVQPGLQKNTLGGILGPTIWKSRTFKIPFFAHLKTDFTHTCNKNKLQRMYRTLVYA